MTVARAVMGAAVSRDGYIADDQDGVGPLFDRYGNGDVAWAFPGSPAESHSTRATADFMRAQYPSIGAVVIGRRLFDLTNGWNGVPAAGEIDSQALRLGLIDEVLMDLVPVVLGSGRPSFATGATNPPIQLSNPTRVVPGDRVTLLVDDVATSRGSDGP